jgi:hypothetical protein
MKSLKSGLLLVSAIGLLLLNACQQTATNSSSNTSNSSPTASVSPPIKTADRSQPQKGGQVVESGAYRLEFVPEPEDAGTHLDLYLQKGDNYETVLNAKVTALIQLPDGTQKTLNLPYDAEGKHYAALFSEKAKGQYQVKIAADIQGEKASGRFNFNR